MAGLQCEQCGLDFPVDDFPDLGSGLGLICKHCMMGIDSDQAQKRLAAKTKAMADEMLDVKGVSELMPKVKTVLGAIYKNFGGPRGFAERVHWMIEGLCARDKVPASAPQLMIQLMKLHLSIEQTEDQNDARTMTEQQIRSEQQIALMQIAMEAAGDPAKRSMLFELLKGQGIAAYEMTDDEQHKKMIDETLERDVDP
jgi:hypothetical protein